MTDPDRQALETLWAAYIAAMDELWSTIRELQRRIERLEGRSPQGGDAR